MSGQTDLRALLAGLSPMLHEGEYVFAVVPVGDNVPAWLDCIGTFREEEGTTWILRREEAERAGIAYTYVCRRITLQVHSSLEAVGLLAMVAGRLAGSGISANVVSAFHHDHLFVPVNRAEEAFQSLQALSWEHSNLLTPST